MGRGSKRDPKKKAVQPRTVKQRTRSPSKRESGHHAEGEPAQSVDSRQTVRRTGNTAESLLDSYRPIVHEWATGKLPRWAREGADTSDLVQVTLQRAWDHLAKFRDQPEEAFRRYLRRILKNEIIDRMRTAKRHKRRVELDEDLPDPAPSALDRLIREEFETKFRAYLDRLTPRRREALLLRLEGHTYLEIHSILGIKTNAARMRVVHAIEDLTAMLGAAT